MSKEPISPMVTMGTNLAFGILGFLLLGNFLDQKFPNENDFWTLLGMFMALCYGIYEISLAIKKINAQEGDRKKQK